MVSIILMVKSHVDFQTIAAIMQVAVLVSAASHHTDEEEFHKVSINHKDTMHDKVEPLNVLIVLIHQVPSLFVFRVHLMSAEFQVM